MFKLKPPIKKLSLAIALTLITGTVSATEVTVASTYKYLFDTDGNPLTPLPLNGAEILSSGDWAAGYFSVNSLACPNGCDLINASVQLDSSVPPLDDTPFNGVQLELYSNQSNTTPGVSLLQFDTLATVRFNGTFGTRIEFTAPAQNLNSPALLQAGASYWLKVTNISQSPDFEWLFNGNDKDGENWASSQFGSGSGTPFMFDVTGDARVVPIPGAIWLMGSALFGLIGTARRKTD